MRLCLLWIGLIVAMVGCKSSSKSGCPSPFTVCSGQCVATSVDVANCGTCGNACGAGQRCVSGTCTISCLETTIQCGSSCVSIMTDSANCGACGKACTAPQMCSAGSCASSCGTGYTACAGPPAYCADFMNDSQNCGACGTVCPAGQRCAAGSCAASCATGRTPCNGACVDTMSDAANCGACGTACPAGEFCQAGACQCDLSGLALGRLIWCGVRTDGTVVCTGGFNNGDDSPQLPDGNSGNAGQGFGPSSPAPIAGFTNIKSLDAGDGYACALAGDTTVWCIGNNRNGRLGDGTSPQPRPSPSPTQVRESNTPTFLSGVTQLSVGGDHACALKSDHTIWCWGEGDSGELGNDGTNSGNLATGSSLATQATLPGGLTGVLKVVAGWHHTCAIAGDHTVWCWGINDNGQCGNGTAVSPLITPAQIASLSNVTDLVSKWDDTCALKDDHTVWCWGHNQHGECSGDATTNPVVSPSPLPFAGAVEIAIGSSHGCARKGDGTVWCWGRNGRGELGNGTVDRTDTSNDRDVSGTPTPTPRPVITADGTPLVASSIMAGHGRGCAVVGASKHPWCWGNNNKGQAVLTIQRSSVATPIFSCGK